MKIPKSHIQPIANEGQIKSFRRIAGNRVDRDFHEVPLGIGEMGHLSSRQWSLLSDDEADMRTRLLRIHLREVRSLAD
jgi:hypothetical protein